MNDYLKIRELYHHGIKGQKWGVRRYQNEDGTLTEAGKVRYNPDGTKKNIDKMTDEELEKANKRIAAEQQFQNLTGTSQPERALTRDNAIKIGATFVATGATTFLLRKWKNGYFLEKGKGGKPAIGRSFVTAALAGSIGALAVAAGTLGGKVQPMTK